MVRLWALALYVLAVSLAEGLPLRAIPQPLSFLEVSSLGGVHTYHSSHKACTGVQAGPDTVGVPAKAPYTGSCCGGLHCPYTRSRCCAESNSCCPMDAECVPGPNPKCHWTQSGKSLVNPTHKDTNTTKWKLPANKTGAPITVSVSCPGCAEKTEKADDTTPIPAARRAVLEVTPKPEPTPLGSAWPPIGSLADDGRSGMWDARVDLDWRGYGMIRNGTKNILPDKESCLDQCQIMEECRLAFYDFVTKECWLDTKFAEVSDGCPHTDGNLQQQCVSFFKKQTQYEMERYKFGLTDTDPKHWTFTNLEDMIGPEHRSLVRSGFFNHVIDFHECLAQCADLKYCRALTFFRPTRECWLGTKPAKEGLLCARRNGLRDCVSAVKHPVKPDLDRIVGEIKDLRDGVDDSPFTKGEAEAEKETEKEAEEETKRVQSVLERQGAHTAVSSTRPNAEPEHEKKEEKKKH